MTPAACLPWHPRTVQSSEGHGHSGRPLGPGWSFQALSTVQEDTRVIRHVSYREDHYPTARACVRGIQEMVTLGWSLLEVRGGANGPFLVLYRKND